MKIADLFAEVGFKFDTIKLHEVSKLIGDLNVNSIIGATSVAALGEGIKTLVDESTALSSNLKTISAITGIDTQFIQRFEDASKAFGATKESADGFLTSLSKIQNDVLTNQGGQKFFQISSILGVDPATFQKIIGTTEGLANYVQKVLSKPLQAGDKAQAERQARIKAWLGSMVGANPDIIKALERPDFFNEMLKFETLSNSQIDANAKATQAWVEVTENLNTKFQELATTILQQLTPAVKSFVNDGGLKTIFNMVEGLMHAVTAAGLVFDIDKTLLKAGALNVQSFLGTGINNAAKLGAEVRKDWSTPVSVTTGPITIQANDTQEFVKRFDEALIKKYMNADLTFSQGQT